MIIAEIGINHMGSNLYLQEYLQTLLNSSVDAITIQVREKDFYKDPKFSNCALPLETYTQVSEMVKKSGKKFGVALSDLDLVSFFDEIVDFYKILSKDINNHNFTTNFINKVDKKIFVSTGLSSDEDIFSFINNVSSDKINNISLIHTRLSNEIEDVNLRAITSMKSTFNLPVAFGNHCENKLVVFACTALEPVAIFLYIKGDRGLQHPDDKHAIKLSKINKFSNDIKNIIKCLGNGQKKKANNTIKGQK